MQTSQPSAPGRWRQRCFLLLAVWILSTFLLSFPVVRGVVAYPLCVHDPNASGDAAYVMADGYAYWERLHAAADLYHMKRVPRIVLLEETRSSGYDFEKRRSVSRVERAVDYLIWHGVPETSIVTVRMERDVALGSLSEARAVASQMPDLQRVVVVTSAPHTRRSRFCFRRSFPDEVEVQVYSASTLRHSAEIDAPIWIEYVKLVVYLFAA